MGSTWKEYVERQKEWIKKHNLKKGDKVKVLRRANDHEKGWGCGWIPSMDETIGKEITIYNFGQRNNGLALECSDCVCRLYPFFVLDPVKAQTQELKVKPPKPKYKPYRKTMTLAQIREFFRG
jgi:hypothetical protein